MEIARAWSRRSTCPRGRVGVVAVDPTGRVLSSGYNGAPAGMAHCDDAGCLMDGEHCVRSIHAEANMIISAARNGVSISGTDVYSTRRPCLRCTMMLIAAHVASLTWAEEYESDDVVKMLEACEEAGIYVYGPAIRDEGIQDRLVPW